MKKLLSIILCGIMIVSMTACKNDTEDGEMSESISESESVSQSQGDGTQTPDDGTQTPDDGTQTPGDGTQTPGDGTQTPDDGTQTPDDTPTVGKSIDIYIIAGQSNAAGHTKITDEASLKASASGLENGYSNILYAGNAVAGAGASYEKAWQEVTLGLGSSSSNMGPEVGMAEALSAYYNKSTGKHAGIIKYARGGTGLTNYIGADRNNPLPNWVPPSFEAQIESWQFKSNPTYFPTEVVEGATGVLYDGLVAQVEKNVRELKAMGYTDINIKGLYWMQGETERGAHATLVADYTEAFECLISDLRVDLSEVMKEVNGSEADGGASDMAVFVGTISDTYYQATENEINVYNHPFVELQKTFPDIVDNCYVVDNSGFEMNRLVNGANVTVGSDAYHWNQDDALQIGKNVGRTILVQLFDIGKTDLEDITISTDNSDDSEYTPFY